MVRVRPYRCALKLPCLGAAGARRCDDDPIAAAFFPQLSSRRTLLRIITRFQGTTVSLSPGARLGPYEVTALIGEGGMGKVWRAHHTALNRDDALKVLPDAFASDPDRLARFRREAQVLASLNHPNIAHVYGLEQADGVQALVME